ncbi:MAG: GxxExxY protein [Anaerolineales bacterium]|nr:GxxExxY protein [Anaerolineales bacterium]
MEVNTALGPGSLESVYPTALGHEFQSRALSFVEHGELDVHFEGKSVGRFRLDFLVEQEVLVELKAVRALSDADDAQLLNYLRGTDTTVGLLLNFGAPSLQWKRRVWSKSNPSRRR